MVVKHGLTASLAVAGVLAGALLGAAAHEGEVPDFDELMRKCAAFKYGNDKPYAHLDPARADANENGMLDVDELAVIAAVMKDEQAPHHGEVHDAFRANETKAAKDLGGLATALLPSLKSVMAGYIVLGDGSFQREPEQFNGSWGVFANHIEGMADYGSGWKTGAPKEEDYTRLADIAGPCGDLDGDSVTNVGEYQAKGKVRADYLAAVVDPAVKDDGGDPDGACVAKAEEPAPKPEASEPKAEAPEPKAEASEPIAEKAAPPGTSRVKEAESSGWGCRGCAGGGAAAASVSPPLGLALLGLMALSRRSPRPPRKR